MYRKKMMILVTTIFLLSICLISARPAKAVEIYPDILLNTEGVMTYTYNAGTGTGLLHFHAIDEKITYAPGVSSSMYQAEPDPLHPGQMIIRKEIMFDLYATINSSGHLVGGVTGDDMTETIAVEQAGYDFSFMALDGTVKTNWNVGDVILNGEVDGFSYAGLTSTMPTFTFQILPSGGKFYDENIFPYKDYGLTIVAAVDNSITNPGWTNNWTVNKVKGDKFPAVPEPASILLLGLGFLGLAGVGATKRRKRG